MKQKQNFNVYSDETELFWEIIWARNLPHITDSNNIWAPIFVAPSNFGQRYSAQEVHYSLLF